MATKSPGIYVNELDNTTYTNVKTSTGTTVCIIGFAKKGPIGVPTEIYSYNSFINTFGYPIDKLYSGMAVRNVLAAGGGVLYVRIADDTASPSKYIAKNAVPFNYGYSYFRAKNNIRNGTYGYLNNANYVFDIAKSGGKDKKTVHLRSPEGMWSLTDIFNSISNQLGETNGYQEIKFKNLNSFSGLYSFNFKDKNDDLISDEPYYLNFTGSTVNISNLSERINKGLKNGSNATFEIGIYGSVNKPSPTDGIDGINNYTTKADTVKEDTVAFILDAETHFDLTYYKGNGTGDASSKKATTGYTKDITFNGTVTFKQVIDKINEKLSSESITCYLKEGDDSDKISKLVFVGEDVTDGFNFCLKTSSPAATQPVTYDELYDNVSDLFLTAEDINQGTTTGEERFYFNASGLNEDTSLADPKKLSDIVGLIVDYQPEPVLKGNKVDSIYVEPTTDSLVVYTTDAGSGNKVICFNDEKHGEYLFNENLLDKLYPAVEGTDAIDIDVAKDGVIYFYKPSEITCPEISYTYEIKDTDTEEQAAEKTKMQEYFLDAVELFDGVASVQGNSAISAENKDMVVFTSKEYGEGTSNLSVQVKTTTNVLYEKEKEALDIELSKKEAEKESLDAQLISEQIKPVKDEALIAKLKELISSAEKDIKDIKNKEAAIYKEYTSHDIIVYQGNGQVEYFENVNYDVNASDSFDKILNETDENGGSKYISVEFVKNDYTTDEIQIQDGRYYLGVANNDADVAYDPKTMLEDDYGKYDYAIGTNGVAEDPTGLFLAELDKEESAIMNKDLYDFHVLITPDCLQDMSVQDAAIACCEERGDAMYIVDPPQSLTKNAVIDWHNGRGWGRTNALNSTYAALYWPWGKAYDTNSKVYVYTMPSVFMAAQYCSVDKAIGPQQAPAGDLYGTVSISDVEVTNTRKDRDELYTDSNRVNPFLKYGNGTIVAYGEKTLQRKNSTLTKVHVRRMMIQIKKDLKSALSSYIFLPSTSKNLSEINAHLNVIMQKYKTNGGVSSFSVVCDSTNNTSETLQQDIINASIHLVPVGTIEQINIDCSLDKSSETVSVS